MKCTGEGVQFIEADVDIPLERRSEKPSNLQSPTWRSSSSMHPALEESWIPLSCTFNYNIICIP